MTDTLELCIINIVIPEEINESLVSFWLNQMEE